MHFISHQNDCSSSSACVAANAILKKTSFKSTLRGLLIGNGWIDPVSQYMAYHDFAFQAGLISRSSSAASNVLAAVTECNQTINNIGPDQVPIHIPACEGILSAITDSTVQT